MLRIWSVYRQEDPKQSEWSHWHELHHFTSNLISIIFRNAHAFGDWMSRFSAVLVCSLFMLDFQLAWQMKQYKVSMVKPYHRFVVHVLHTLSTHFLVSSSFVLFLVFSMLLTVILSVTDWYCIVRRLISFHDDDDDDDHDGGASTRYFALYVRWKRTLWGLQCNHTLSTGLLQRTSDWNSRCSDDTASVGTKCKSVTSRLWSRDACSTRRKGTESAQRDKPLDARLGAKPLVVTNIIRCRCGVSW